MLSCAMAKPHNSSMQRGGMCYTERALLAPPAPLAPLCQQRRPSREQTYDCYATPHQLTSKA